MSTTTLASGQLDVPYSTALVAAGGTAPYSWALTGGTLPPGLSLNSSTGTISGTPTTVTTTPLTVTVTDTETPAQTATATVTLIVSAASPNPLAITTTSLPSAALGQPYTTTLTASGGTAPFTWVITGGTLPAGLALNASSGTIAGSPTVLASAALTVTLSDSGHPTQSRTTTLTLLVVPAVLGIATASLPAGQVGSPYGATLGAAGGTTPYTWTITSGSLPAGLALNATTGAITGIPTVSTTGAAFTIKVTDAGNPVQSNSRAFTLVVAPATLLLTTTALPGGQVGKAYSAALAATGGTIPYTWTVVSGTLPAGLALNAASGAISGIPTASSAGAAVTFKATDAGNPAQSASGALTLIIAPATLGIATTSLPGGQVGKPYSATLAAAGGTVPYTWTITSGTLPAGLALNAASGAIAGIPTASTAGAAVTFKATDAGNPAQSASGAFTLVITPAAILITTTTLPAGQVGVFYSSTLGASGGQTPYSWTLTAGALPAGLTLNPAGAISGTPTASTAGAAFTLKVTDASNPAQSTSLAFTLRVTPAALAITTSALPNGQVGKAYSIALAASGGTSPYTWALTSGTLPAGLALNVTSGDISGLPTASTSGATLTFQATDAGNPAQKSSRTFTLVITPAALTITTTSLPNGQVGAAYSAGVSASGGTTPYNWTLTGTLPAGLNFNTATGVISGVPGATAAATSLQFSVRDAGTPAQTQTAVFTLTVTNPGAITVKVSPVRAGVTVTQALTVSATTNDSAGVRWSVSPAGGSFSSTTSASGVNVTFTAPATAGAYTVTATSVSDTTQSASLSVGVTSLGGVYTYHNDVARDGANTQEFALTLTNVNTASFGKLFSCTVDGALFAQPLWVASLTVGGARHNVIFVATEHDSLYAFDADASPCVKLWQVSLIDTSHGGNVAGETSVPAGTVDNLVGLGLGNLAPEAGVTGTPVVDPASGTLYVVSKSVVNGTTTIYQRLHAIDVKTGNEKTGGPAVITGSYPGTGSGGTSVAFSPQMENQRTGLAFANGTLYIAWGSHEDAPPWYGWVMAYTYNGTAFTQSGALNVSPNLREGGIWMGGGAPSADNNGHVYVITGNGGFDATNTSGPTNDYGDSFLQLNSALGISSSFTPSDQATENANDLDFGSGGSALLVNLTSGTLRHLVIGGGKDGVLYLVNGDNMGGYGDAQAFQFFSVGTGIFCTPAFWNNTLYLAPSSASMLAYGFNPASNMFTTTASARTPTIFGYPGSTPTISASNATDNGIAWILDNTNYCTGHPSGCGPAVLHAYKAANLYSELWNSSMVSGDAAGFAVKFTVPTVANGKVYVGTRGNNIGGVFGSTSISGELDVYGLKPN